MRIGIFDSGIGGLTVLKKLIDNYKYHEYIYIGDTINLPYGNKDINELRIYSSRIIEYLINKRVDLIIIACGTISSNLAKEIKDKYKIKIIDIISPTITYLKNNKYKSIGLIGTCKTIESRIIENNLFSHNIKVISKACPKLVDIIENNLLTNINITNTLKEYLLSFKNTDIELLVLGCTHYPLINKYINKCISVNTLDISDSIIPIIEDGSSLKINIYYTKLNNKLINNTLNIINRKCIIEEINI